MLKTCLLVIIGFQLILLKVSAQEITYFHKIENVLANDHSDSSIYKKIDSIKRTRRPHDSNLEIFFNRDVDFEYLHQRINVEFNGTFYQVNLLLKKDSVLYSSLVFDPTFLDNTTFKRYKTVIIDTVACTKYLKLRNDYYRSSKTINDLSSELTLDEEYAFYCGDGDPKTIKGMYIENLAKRKRIGKLLGLIKSISCEEQAYGVAGFDMLQKNNVMLSIPIKKLIAHIKKRNSDLVSCSGCIGHLIRKAYQDK